MKVLKFGGTSVGSTERMDQIIDILVHIDSAVIVVLSAMDGTTNSLAEICRECTNQNFTLAQSLTEILKDKYLQHAHRFASPDNHHQADDYITKKFTHIQSKFTAGFDEADSKMILAQGELLSTYLFALKCAERGLDAQLLSALDFMHLGPEGQPSETHIRRDLKSCLSRIGQRDIIVTQGYICRNHNGQIDNLDRGGSDYTATLIGSILQAEEIQIWTDIDGFRSNDPRVVKETFPIRFLSYREAAELAYFGAKILHPACVLPAEKMNIPVRLKYTMNPEAAGTLISDMSSGRPITAIAAKDGITVIKIYSHRMLNAFGFLRKVFQVFEDFETPVDMITTSEVALSLTIDDNSRIDDLVQALYQFGEVQSESDHTIICIVGTTLFNRESQIKEIFDLLGDIPLRMVSMGGSRYNISLLVETKYKESALERLNLLFDSLVAV